MSPFDDPIDPPAGWQLDHLRTYVETGGATGHEWRPGVPTLLLTTIGRRSGRAHRTPLIYGPDGDNVVVVASKGGSPDHPLWYFNLTADPSVRVQVAADVFDAVAHTPTGADRARLWPVMVKIWPAYEEYQQRTEREIPVVVLVPKR